jgi:hypothetical protein
MLHLSLYFFFPVFLFLIPFLIFHWLDHVAALSCTLQENVKGGSAKKSAVDIKISLCGLCRGFQIEGISDKSQIIHFPATIPLYATSIEMPLKNLGAEPIDITFSAYSGTCFSVRPQHMCLQAGETREYEITFLPTEMGNFTGSILAEIDGSSNYEVFCKGKCGFVLIHTNYPLGKIETPTIRPYEKCAVDLYITNAGSLPLQFQRLETDFHGTMDLVFREQLKTQAEAFVDKPPEVCFESQWDKLKARFNVHHVDDDTRPESFTLQEIADLAKLKARNPNRDYELPVLRRNRLHHLTAAGQTGAMDEIFIGCYEDECKEDGLTSEKQLAVAMTTIAKNATTLMPSSTGHFILTLKAYKQGTHRALCNFFFTPQIAPDPNSDYAFSFSKEVNVVSELGITSLTVNSLLLLGNEVDFGTIPMPPALGSVKDRKDLHFVVYNRSICDQEVKCVQSKEKIFIVQKSQILVKAGLEEPIPISFVPTKENVLYEGHFDLQHQFGTHTVKLRGIGGTAILEMKCPTVQYPGLFSFPLGEFSALSDKKPYVLDFGVVNVHDNVMDNLIFVNLGKLYGSYSLTCIGDKSFSLGERERQTVKGIVQAEGPGGEITVIANCFPKRKYADGADLLGLVSLTWEKTPGGKVSKCRILLHAKIGRKKLILKEKSVNFGLTMLRSSMIRCVHLQNLGDTPLKWNVDKRNVDSNIISQIKFSEESGELACKEEKQVMIVFTPTELAHLSAHVSFQSDGGFCPLLLSGHSAVPFCEIKNETIDFGIVPVFSSENRTIDLVNTGSHQVFYKVVVLEYHVKSRSGSLDDQSKEQGGGSGLQTAPDGDGGYVQQINTEGQENIEIEVGAFVMTPQRGTIYPKQTSTIIVTCSPRDAENIETLRYHIITEEAGSTSEVLGSLVCESGGVELRFEPLALKAADSHSKEDVGAEKGLQISVSENCMQITCHFGVCVQGKVFTKQIASLKNDGNIACEWFVDIPDEPGTESTVARAAVGTTVLEIEEERITNFLVQPESGSIQKGQVIPLFVSFVGHEPGSYNARLCIVNGRRHENSASLTLDLSASVGRFALECAPSSLEFGKCQMGIIHTRVLDLFAEGSFPIKYEATIIADDKASSTQHLRADEPMFICEPAVGVISPNAKKVIMVTFNLNRTTTKPELPGGGDIELNGKGSPGEKALQTPYKAILRISWRGTALEVPLMGIAASSYLQWSVPFSASSGSSDIYTFSDTSMTCAQLAFPIISVGQTHTMKMYLKNVGELKSEFSCRVNNEYLDLSFDEIFSSAHVLKLEKGHWQNCCAMSAMLEAGEGCYVQVTYLPATKQEFEEQLWLESAEGRKPITIKCFSDELKLDVEGNMNFGRVALNTMVARTIKIQNLSPISCEIDIFSAGEASQDTNTILSNTRFHGFPLLHRTPYSTPFTCQLDKYDTQEFEVKATICKEGEYFEILVIQPRIGNNILENLSKQIDVVALVSDDHLCVDNISDVNFGCQGVGTQKRCRRILSNPSKGDVEFRVSVECSNQECTSWRVYPQGGCLKSKESIDIFISFSPSDVNDFSDNVIMHFHNVTAAIVDSSITCFGKVGVPRLSTSPVSTFHFGPQQKHASIAQRMTVSNKGDADLVWTVQLSHEDFAHEGTEHHFWFLPYGSDDGVTDEIMDDPSSFEGKFVSALIGNCDTDTKVLSTPLQNAFVLPAGQEENFFVVFKPTQEGSHEASVDVVSNAGTKSTIFFGTGVHFCLLSPIPASMALPDCELGCHVRTKLALQNGSSVACPVEIIIRKNVHSSRQEETDGDNLDNFFSASPPCKELPPIASFEDLTKNTSPTHSTEEDGIDFIFSTVCEGSPHLSRIFA